MLTFLAYRKLVSLHMWCGEAERPTANDNYKVITYKTLRWSILFAFVRIVFFGEEDDSDNGIENSFYLIVRTHPLPTLPSPPAAYQIWRL